MLKNIFFSLGRLVYHPMLYLSIGLHVGLLMLHIPGTTDSSKSSETEENQEEEVDLTALLSQAQTVTPTPKASASAKPSPTPTPTATPLLNSKLPPIPEPTPIPTPTPKATPIPQATATPQQIPTPSPQPGPSPQAPTTSEPTPEPSPSPTTIGEVTVDDNFLAQLGQVLREISKETLPAGISPYSIIRQKNAFYVDPATPQPGIRDISMITQRTPEYVSSEIQSRFETYIFKLEGQYGGGDLYQVKKDDRVYCYLSLVKTSSLTIFAIWLKNPNS
jgi:hypothetical protein